MKIAFYQDHICLRGTTVAMVDYAKYNQEILGNDSVVIYNRTNKNNDDTAIKNVIENDISLVCLDDFSEIHDLTRGCKLLYQQRACASDGRLSSSCKNVIHQIGANVPHSQSWGDVYAYASEWLRTHNSVPNAPLVPYIVTLPHSSDNFRESLGIPKEAIVFGRSGGPDTWNLPWSNHVILKILEVRKDIYFLFQNTPIPFEHEKVIHVEKTSNLDYKVKFINTCDAMLHARHEGESFGMSCAEFSIRNKPVITWDGSRERNHIDILGDRGVYYSDAQSMFDCLYGFVKHPEKNWNCYGEFSPGSVMKLFMEVFMD